jgi:predicted kinase
MRELILLRGLPGAGKSTLAMSLAEGKYPVLSVDDYFTRNGKYEFKFEENHLAYKSCEERTIEQMKIGTEKIFVDNTFTLDWEMEPYFKAASENNYRIHVLTVENYHGGKNTHEVSDDQIKKMAEKYKVKLY